MKRSHRLFVALVGGVLLAGVATGPAMAASSGALTITPATGSFQFGNGNPADLLSITPATADCPAGSDFYADSITQQGAESTANLDGAVLTQFGTVNRDPQTPILSVHQHNGTFQDGNVQNIVDTILPFGTTDSDLSATDAAKPVGTRIATGDFSIVGFCMDTNFEIVAESDTTTVTLAAATRAAKPANWPVGQAYDVLQWTWSIGGGSQPGGPAATSTSLSASPAGSAAHGTAVTLTAGVNPAAATGSVEFFDGTTSLGTKPVTAGAASTTTDTLAVGSRSLRAVFTPDDASAYGASTGTLGYTITDGSGGGGGGPQPGAVTLQATVPTTTPEALTLTVDPTAPVALPDPTRDGDSYTTSASGVDLATVTDTRSTTKPGWNVSGTVEDTFVGGDASHTFPGTALGWTPSVLAQSTDQAVTGGPVVTPGSTPGLTGAGSSLASAAAGAGIGTAKLGADLGLRFPATTPADTYHADITVTVI